MPIGLSMSPGLNKALRRRTDVEGIHPNRDAVIHLVGAVLAAARRSGWSPGATWPLRALAKARLRIITGDLEDVTEHALSEVT